MESRRPATRTLLAAAIAVAVTTAGIAVALQLRDRMVPTPGPTVRPTEPSTSPQPPPVSAAFEDFGFEPGTAPASPTSDQTQSRLWIHDGQWWGVLGDPFSTDFHIFRLDWETQTWQDTGVLVDTRDRAEPDVLVDGDRLYVVSSGGGESGASRPRLLRYSYLPEARSWDLDRNFPIDLAPTGVPSPTIARDSGGVLWLTYPQNGRVMVNRTFGDDLLWGEPHPLPVDGAEGLGQDDMSTIVSWGPGRIGVMWSDRTGQAVSFASRRDGDPDDAWTVETVVEGLQLVDTQLSLKTAMRGGEQTVVAALKTALDEGAGANRQAPLILLATREPGTGWQSHLVGRVRDRHNHPIVVVDDAAHIVHVFATSPGGGGAIFHKSSPLDRISFEAGRGTAVIGDEQGSRIVNATSTKQSVGPDTGLVVLAWDSARERYVHAVVDVGDDPPLSRPGATPSPSPSSPGPSGPGSPSPSSPGPSGPSPSPPPAVPVVNDLVDDDFNPWPVGPNTASGWYVRSDDPALAFQILDGPTPDDHVAGIRTTLATDSPRACKELGAITSGVLTVDARVRLGALGASDGTVTSLRGPAGEAVTVRFGQGGTFAYYAGATKVRTPVPFRAGVWYRSILQVDLAGRTYNWELRADGATAALVRVNRVPWRNDDSSLDELCFVPSAGRAGLDISFDDVSARR